MHVYRRGRKLMRDKYKSEVQEQENEDGTHDPREKAGHG